MTSLNLRYMTAAFMCALVVTPAVTLAKSGRTGDDPNLINRLENFIPEPSSPPDLLLSRPTERQESPRKQPKKRFFRRRD